MNQGHGFVSIKRDLILLQKDNSLKIWKQFISDKNYPDMLKDPFFPNLFLQVKKGEDDAGPQF